MQHANLVRLVAAVDAAFAPGRYRDDKGDIVRGELQHGYARGLPWQGSGTSTERNIRMVALDALEEQGLIIRYRGTGPRSFSCRPTDLGYDTARRLVYMPDYEESAGYYLGRLVELHDHPGASELDGETWISEELVADHKWGQEDTWPFVYVGVAIVPCLIRELVYVNSSRQGQVYYQLADKGRELWESGSLNNDIDEYEYDQAAQDLYWSEFFKERRLHSCKEPQDKNCIGTIPLPVSMCPKSKRKK